MKKIISVGMALPLIVVGAVGLVSCGNQSDSPTNANTNIVDQMMTLSGTIQKNPQFKSTLADAAKSEREYVLQSDDDAQKVTYLTSDQVYLAQFEGKHVTLNGYYSSKENEIFSVVNVLPLATNENQNVSLGMKTFAGTYFGVSFQFPGAWSIEQKDADKIAAVEESGDEAFSMYRVTLVKGETPEQWIQKNYPGKETRDYVVGEVSTATRIVTANADELVIIVPMNKNLYSIHFNYKGKTMEPLQASRAFSDVLTSMKFFPVDASTTTMMNSNSSSALTSPTSDASSVYTPVNDESSAKKTETPASKNNNSNVAKNSTSPAAADVAPKTSSASIPQVVAFLKANPTMLPVSNTATQAKIGQIELAANNYVYVTFTDGDAKKKVLYSYRQTAANDIELAQVGLFEQGQKTSWTTVSGSNPAASSARELYNVSSTGDVEMKTTVNKGNSLYENSRLGIQAQYPKSWYFASSTADGAQVITFTDKPTDEVASAQVQVKVLGKGKADTSSAVKTTVGGKEVYQKSNTDGSTTYYIAGKDGKMFETTATGSDASNAAVKEIISTLEESK